MTDSTNNSFEEQWQNAFDDTQLTPPESVWEKIELTLKPENTPPSKPNFGNKPYYFLGGIVAGLLGLFLWLKSGQIIEKQAIKGNKNEPVNLKKVVEAVKLNVPVNTNHEAKFVEPLPLSVSPQTTSSVSSVSSVETQTTAEVVGEDTNHGAEKTTTIDEVPDRTLTDSIEIITPLTTKSIHSEIENPTIILPIDQTPYYVKPSIKTQKKSIFKNVKISVGAGAYQP